MTAVTQTRIATASLSRLSAARFAAGVFIVFLIAAGRASAAEPPDREKTIQAFEGQDRKQTPEPGGVLFLGSSTIRFWNTAKAFPELKAINRGFGGSQIDDSVKFAELVQEFILSDRRLSYIDVVKPMLDDKGQPRAELFQKDMLHLNEEGYELWNSVVKPCLGNAGG